MRTIVLALCVGVTGCYPPIDELVRDEPGGASNRGCSLPDPALGVAPPSSLAATAYPELTGSSITVEPGADLQAALDAAVPGDELVLTAGSEYPGPLELPYKSDDGVIVIRSSALSELPPGRTVTLDDRAKLATILATDSGPAVIAEERASGYRLAGIELRPPAGVEADELMVVGSTASTIAAALPNDIVIDRSLIRGDPTLGARIGVQLNTRGAAIVDSRIVDIKTTVTNGGGLLIDNAPGPILIHQSVIEASWINVAIGQTKPGSPELFPSDIALCKSVLDKPAEWQNQGWATRALLEIGRGRRILVAGSLIYTSWPDVQPGVGMAVAAKGADEGLPTEDIAFVDVRVRDVNIAYDVYTSGAIGDISRFLIQNSEFSNVRDRLMRLLGGGVKNLTLVHVTALPDHSILDGSIQVSPDLLLRDGLFDEGSYGIRGDSKGSGIDALDFYFAPWTVSRNIIAGASASAYPPDNFYPPTLFEAGVIDAAAGNFRLSPDSPYAGQASDGTDPGADIDRLEAALPTP